MITGRLTIRYTPLVIAIGVLNFARASEFPEDKDYGSPERFEKAIRAFEAKDQEEPPQSGAIVCIGSSSIRIWHETISKDLAPLTVIPRGFGGSNMNDALHYADRIVMPYKPRAVVIYEGDNDVAQGIAPKRIAATFRAFVSKVHKHLPETRIYFLSIKPSISRRKLWPQMEEANRLIADECSKGKQLIYVDVASRMLDTDGKPRKDIFQSDNLHMRRSGYVIWRDVLRPILVKMELPFEAQKDADKNPSMADVAACPGFYARRCRRRRAGGTLECRMGMPVEGRLRSDSAGQWRHQPAKRSLRRIKTWRLATRRFGGRQKEIRRIP